MSSFLVLFFGLQILPAALGDTFLGAINARQCPQVMDSCSRESLEEKPKNGLPMAKGMGKSLSCFRSVTTSPTLSSLSCFRSVTTSPTRRQTAADRRRLQRIDPTVYTVVVTSAALEAPSGATPGIHPKDPEHTRVAKLLRVPSQFFPVSEQTTCANPTTCETPLVDEFVSLTSTGGFDMGHEHWMADWSPTGFRAGEHGSLHLLLGDHINLLQDVLGVATDKPSREEMEKIVGVMLRFELVKARLMGLHVPNTDLDRLQTKLLEQFTADLENVGDNESMAKAFREFLQRLKKRVPVLKVFLYTCRARSALAEAGSFLDKKFDMPEGTFHVLPIEGSVTWLQDDKTGKFYVQEMSYQTGTKVRGTAVEKEYLETALQLKSVSNVIKTVGGREGEQ